MRNNLKAVSRNRKALVLGAAFSALAASIGSPKPAQATPAGLTLYPATDIYGKGNFHFDADLFSDRGRESALTSFGLSYGLGPDRDGIFGRSEIGIDYVTGGTATSGPDIDFEKRFLVNAKTQLYNNDDSAVRVVAGLWGFGSRGDFANTVFPPNVVYVLGSKAFDFGRFHLGFARITQKETFITTPAGNDDRNMVQYGFDKVFAGGKFQFTFDGWTGKNAYAAQAPGLIYYINDKAAVQLGYIRYNDESAFPARNQVYFGFDYNFGGSAPTPPAEAQPAQPGATGPSADGTSTTPGSAP